MDRNDRGIRTIEDVLGLLDGLFAPGADRWTNSGTDTITSNVTSNVTANVTSSGAQWWDGFYTDRDKAVPFFVAKPDENLVSYVERGLLPAGARVLDLGCGPGRNALYLASLGHRVDAVDLSATAIRWAEERAAQTGTTGVRFICGDAFAPDSALEGPYDLVYDSGCFHHLPPHRRISHLALLDRLLAPGGLFGLTAFAAGEGGMGSELPDADFYRQGRLDGGLAYTDTSLRALFRDLTEIEIRRMRDEAADSPVFGESFLWTGLFRR
ncbi:class I SAM-dependent methyltransferase [Streptomyces zaomyceticus]|uniref:class I SAM-dependent methyltransferase n=1 Tax=Streptomyces zaomyceticus TaxID=68286 RepID=UPI002E1060E9|nr:class I SAM-dependent methyltransferase [Streptomyces zaomyceticus]